MRITTVGLVLFLSLFAKACEETGTSTAGPTPPAITITLAAPASVTRDGTNDHIINGTSAPYKVTITRPAGSGANLAGIVEIHGFRDELPGQAAFDHVLGTGPTTVNGDNATTTITLTCNPAPPPIGGRSGTLGGASRDSQHGGRVCVTGPAVTCTDDAVTVYARFDGVNSPITGILCIPSVGPTTGTL